MKPSLWTILCVLVMPLGALALDHRQQAEIVAAHNQWRGAVGVPALVWSDRLAALASGWANRLKERSTCAPMHNPESRDRMLGENIFWASPIMKSSGARERQDFGPMAVVDAWASEREDYDYARNACASGKLCGHYTQIVWKDTREVGCGYAVCQDETQVWVCNYTPAGNIVSQKPY